MDTPTTKLPHVLVIVGSTGVGKTRLGVEMAHKFNGEVINADSMQVYNGLPIATNQPDDSEMDGIVHHLLGEVDPARTNFNVTEYCKLAIPIIEDIHKRGKLPIIVGGTIYYILSLLWSDSLVSFSPSKKKESYDTHSFECINSNNKEELSMMERLEIIDPIMASRLHPNEIRKIKRSLEIYETTGLPHSTLIKEQSTVLRYHACIMWLQCSSKILDARLDKRVEGMLQNGIIEEVIALKKHLSGYGVETLDTTKGIFQAIGYKELLGCIDAESCDTPDSGDRCSIEECLNKLKRNTRHYARKQRNWIVRSLLSKIAVYTLDSSDVDHWESLVYVPAVDIVTSWLAGNEESVSKYLEKGEEVVQLTEASKKKHVCDLCGGKVLMGDSQWSAHTQSRQHKRRKKKKERQLTHKINRKEDDVIV